MDDSDYDGGNSEVDETDSIDIDVPGNEKLPDSTVSDSSYSGSSSHVSGVAKQSKPASVTVPTLEDLGAHADEYEMFPEEWESKGSSDDENTEDQRVVQVVSEVKATGRSLRYRVRLADGKVSEMPHNRIVSLVNGRKTLDDFLSGGKRGSKEASSDDDYSITGGSEVDETLSRAAHTERSLRQHNFLKLRERRLASMKEAATQKPAEQEGRATRSKGLKGEATMLNFKRSPQSDDDDYIFDHPPRKSEQRATGRRRRRTESEEYQSEDEYTRRSGRSKRHRPNYAEPALHDDFEQDSDEAAKPKAPAKPKLAHSKEIFPTFSKDDEFVKVHNQLCETCQARGPSDSRGNLVFCQGCSASYHKDCIGQRTAREHLVTKVSSTNFVLQCRRCIGKPKIKDPLQASWDRCTDCGVQGASCAPFKPLNARKTTSRDYRELTPNTEVPLDLLYVAGNVLFRCHGCSRVWHYGHLPKQHSDFRCSDCISAPGKIDKIVAWRPMDPEAWDARILSLADFTEDEREYLVKFESQSYFHVKWVPSPWVAGAFASRRLGFLKNNPHAIVKQENAIDEAWLRVEIILDVAYTSYVPVGSDVKVDLARVREVSRALIKYKGLGYEEVYWDQPPKESNADRWTDWKTAYYDYVHGLYVRPANNVAKKIDKARRTPFNKLELGSQPKYIRGGTLMDYQKEGMNWLYYKWWDDQSVVLADEMGLGKTIQIISFLAVLFEEHKIWPFLVVAPQSTVPNWKREIHAWAPSLRVVAYYGTDIGRKLARQHEMFGKDGRLKCHIVVTSYTTPVADSSILRRIPWQVLIVDEGQCLKNDKAQLYTELKKYGSNTHKVLLSGTPLQNNPRELFNMLQFINPKEMKAQELEDEFGIPTVENVPKLHSLIRPYFLRRTKVQVLTNLPPMAEVIVPLSMSALQKRLYKSILEKDAKMIRSLLSRDGKIAKSEKGGVRNLLMQLRKCICHPYVYSNDIQMNTEEDSADLIYRNLIEAGSKLQLLNIMLPKLKERGHRVLIFSQFLGMLDVMEEFLTGLGLKWYRLDGTVSSLKKQKAIDDFNSPGSDYFAFLLSTRAGGVGINLATADTVIIMDPDHNPHSDMQALSRAHRIGQKNKVLVFHLMTRDTVEEKIMQVGKKKKSLDHLIIERMGDDDSSEMGAFDVENILAFGVKRLFEDTDDRIIKYDSESVDKLLDRSKIEETKVAEDGGAFSFARVWANDKATLEETDFSAEPDPENSVEELAFWDRIVMEREEIAKKEAQAKEEELGRGRRRKTITKYAIDDVAHDDDDNDTDFRADEKAQESDSSRSGSEEADIDQDELMLTGSLNGHGKRSFVAPRFPPLGFPASGFPASRFPPPDFSPPGFPRPVGFTDFAHQPYFTSFAPQPGFAGPAPQRLMGHASSMAPVAVPIRNIGPISGNMASMFPLAPPINAAPINQHTGQVNAAHNVQPMAPTLTHPFQFQRATIIPSTDDANFAVCRACRHRHAPGSCSIKQSGVELCPLCKIAHFARPTSCPHMSSETQLNMMLETLRESTESKELVDIAKKVIRGRKGTVRREKSRAAQLGPSADGSTNS